MTDTPVRMMTVLGVQTELAGYWGEAPSERTIRRWILAGEFGSDVVRTHDGFRIPRDAFKRFLARRRTCPPTTDMSADD